MSSGLLEESKKQQSKFQQTRSILYGNKYDNVNWLRKGIYNTYSLWRLTKAETGNALSASARAIREISKNTKNGVKDWYKESGFGEAVKDAGKKMTTVGKSIKDFTVRHAKNAGGLMAAGAQKVYEKGKEFNVKNINEHSLTAEVEFNKKDYKRFFESLSGIKVKQFVEKPFTLQDYFMSFYKEEKEFGGLSGVRGNSK